MVPPDLFWQGVSWGWPGIAPQRQEHRQLIPELQVKNKDHVNWKGLLWVRFSNSFSSLEAAVSVSSKIIFMLWEQTILYPSAQSYARWQGQPVPGRLLCLGWGQHTPHLILRPGVPTAIATPYIPGGSVQCEQLAYV